MEDNIVNLEFNSCKIKILLFYKQLMIYSIFIWIHKLLEMSSLKSNNLIRKKCLKSVQFLVEMEVIVFLDNVCANPHMLVNIVNFK
jgi:hypothetical protein